jgi:hypothetical protein
MLVKNEEQAVRDLVNIWLAASEKGIVSSIADLMGGRSQFESVQLFQRQGCE